MPVIHLPYTPKGAAHTAVIHQTLGGRVYTQPVVESYLSPVVERRPPTQEQLLSAMRGAMGARGNGLGTAVDLNNIQPPPSMEDFGAVNAVNAYTRTRLAEDGFYRRIMPPLPIENHDVSMETQAPRSEWQPVRERYAAEQAAKDLAAQDAVRIKSPTGRARNIIRDEQPEN